MFFLIFYIFWGKTEAIFLINALIRFRGHLELLCSSTSSKVTEIVCRYLSEIPYGKLKRERKLYFGNFGTGKATEECLRKRMDEIKPEMGLDLPNAKF